VLDVYIYKRAKATGSRARPTRKKERKNQIIIIQKREKRGGKLAAHTAEAQQ